MIAALGLSLLPKRVLFGAGLTALLMGGALVNRQCAVMEANGDLKREQAAHAAARAELATCNAARGALAEANAQFTNVARAQNKAIETLQDSARRRDLQAAAALRGAQAFADEQRSAAQWLAQMLGRKADAVKPGECEAAAAARVVREALR